MNRALNEVEHTLWLMDQIISQNIVMGVKVKGRIEASTIRKSLDWTREKYPPLRARIQMENGAPYFTSENTPPVPLIIEAGVDDASWFNEMEDELKKPLPYHEGPLFRARAFIAEHQTHLLITYSHNISDGLGGVNFLRDFLTVLGKLNTGRAVPQPEPLPEYPNSLELLRDEIKANALKCEYPHIDTRRAIGVQQDGEFIASKVQCRYTYRRLPEETSNALVKKCKQENTTVHGAICAALFQEMASEAKKTGVAPSDGPCLIGCCSPVNIRHLFKMDVCNGLGNFISDAIHYQEIDDKASLWESARLVKKTLNEVIESGADIQALLKIGEVLKMVQKPVGALEELRKLFPPVMVTNMGRINLVREYDELYLDAFHYHGGIIPVTHDGYALIILNLFGELQFGVAYAEPLLTLKSAEQLTEKVIQRLKEALHQ